MKKMRKAIAFVLLLVMGVNLFIVSHSDEMPSFLYVNTNYNEETGEIMVSGKVADPSQNEEIAILVVDENKKDVLDITPFDVLYIDQIEVDSNGEFFGTFSLTDRADPTTAWLICGSSFIEILKKPLVSNLEYNITGIAEPPGEIEIPIETGIEAVTLPNKLKAICSDGETREINVTWNCPTFDASSVGEFMFNANFGGVPTMINFGVKVKVVPTKVFEVPTKYTTTVEFGKAFDKIGLPTKMNVKCDNNKNYDVAVNWKKGNYNSSVAGDYEIEGNIVEDNNIKNPNQVLAKAKVTVLSGTQKMTYTIVSVQTQSKTVSYGTIFKDIGLPKELVFKVKTLVSGEEKIIDKAFPVLWNDSGYISHHEKTKAQTYTITGNLDSAKITDDVRQPATPILPKYQVTVSAKATSQPPGGGNGGGGGGGGPQNPTATPAPTPSPTPEPEEPKETSEFNDLGGFDWAKDDIATLVKKGIINGKGNNEFQPKQPISRAEFTKIIIVAFGIKSDPKNAFYFEDMRGHWAEEFVVVGASRGIIKGISEKEFGPNMNVTREQAAAILMRTVGAESLNLPLGTINIDFSDENDISDYAKENVKTLVGCEIIKGKENNKFDPQGTLTRAEAAVLINRMMQKLGL